jgi:hypothetical protein
MPQRITDRRDPSQALPSPLHRRSNPVLALQRSIGNRAVAQVLARDPVATGTVHIGGIGEIKVKGGNLAAWTAKDTPDTVDVTSVKGKHSAKLEKLAGAGTRMDLTVTIAPALKEGEELNVGGGTLLEIKGARVKDYTIDGGVETWRIADFQEAHRTKVTHRIGSG